MLPPLSATAAPELHGRYEARLANALPAAAPAKLSASLPHRTARRSKYVYSDRFIPSRVASKLDTGFELSATSPPRCGNQNQHGNAVGDAAHAQLATSVQSSAVSVAASATVKPLRTRAASSYSLLLKSELLGIHPAADARRLAPAGRPATGAAYDSSVRVWSAAEPPGALPARSPTAPGRAEAARPGGGALASNLLRFKAPRQSIHDEVKTSMSLLAGGVGVGGGPRLRRGGGAALEAEPRRKIARAPFKVLDAPALQDDFYLNLVDWSAADVVAVGLGASVFLWSACSSKVSKLCDLGARGDAVTSVAWSQRGSFLSVGTTSGEVQLWDVTAGKRVRSMSGHAARVGTLAWGSGNADAPALLASGSRDRSILLRDPRCPEATVARLAAHKQEVCGLKWSFDGKQLASGGNDNKLCIWSVRGGLGGAADTAATPVARFSEHSAAVKAIAWSPHQHGLLASGGGTADRCIRFWNTQSLSALGAVDTGSQVCNLVWAKTANEVVSTHGYSLNQIIVWKYPSMDKLATLTGHRLRVLYLAMSPDGQTIVTGAGDETLRFWNAFPSAKRASRRWGGALGAKVLLPLGIGGEIR